MKSPTRSLADFVVDVSFDDLPDKVVKKSKRIILDTIGCALGGYTTEIGVIAINYINSLGGHPECTVIGNGKKTSNVNAAYANGRLANALDADETSAVASSHPANATLAASMACCESANASGRDLITSFTVGYDIASRLGVSMNRYIEGIASTNVLVFGAVSSAGKALELENDEMTHSLGIAGANTPIFSHSKWRETARARTPLFKYADAGWCAHVGVSAALLARLGMTGYYTILDGENGFWKSYGASKIDFDLLTRDMGMKWYVMESTFKPWPSCRFTHYPITAFLRIMNEHKVELDEIEEIRIHPNPLSAVPPFTNQSPKNMVACQFSHPHSLAMAAFDIPAGPEWQSPEKMNSAEITSFRKKVFVKDPSFAPSEEKRLDKKLPCRVEVVAGGRHFAAETEYAIGDPWSPETIMTYEQLKRKFRILASSVAATSDEWRKRVEKIIKTIDTLEDLPKVKDLTRLLSP